MAKAALKLAGLCNSPGLSMAAGSLRQGRGWIFHRPGTVRGTGADPGRYGVFAAVRCSDVPLFPAGLHAAEDRFDGLPDLATGCRNAGVMKGQPLIRVDDPKVFASTALNLNSVLIVSGAVSSETVTDAATLTSTFGSILSINASTYGQYLTMAALSDNAPGLYLRLIGEEGFSASATNSTGTAVPYGQTAGAVSNSVIPIRMNVRMLDPAQAG
jgi:hypothetical protein